MDEIVKYQALINSSQDFIGLSDLNQKVIFINPAGRRMVGISKNDIQKTKILDYFSPQEKDKAAKLLGQLLKGKEFVAEISFQHFKTKKLIPVSWSGIVIYNPQTKKPIGYGTVTRDITEQRKTAQVLSESEQRFRILADNSPNLCWTAYPTGEIFWYNSHWYKYTGTSVNDMKGDGWQKVHDPHILPTVIKQWKKTLKSFRTFEMEVSLKRADGVFRPFLTRVVPIYDEKGKLIEWFGSHTDITEQKKAEETQKKLAAIVETSDDAIVSKNLSSIITSWNKGAEKIFGYTAKEMIGKSIRRIIPPELQREEDEIIALLKQGKRIEHFQTVRVAKSGKKIDVSITISPIIDRNGVIIGASKIARDISEEKHIQKQKDEFLAIASHELKTPVTSIKAYGQVLQTLFQRKGDMDAVKALQKLDFQVNKLTTLIRELLDVTRIQTGKLEFQEDFFDINELVEEIVEDVQLTTQRHTLIKKLGPTQEIYGDRDRIGQVIINLITNAVKYSPQGDKVIITTATKKNAITVTVQDFGFGIPKEKQKQVFEQFFRMGGPQYSTVSGLGLGLYISSTIIKRRGGKIWVESEMGKGSTFCFSLPMRWKGLSRAKKEKT